MNVDEMWQEIHGKLISITGDVSIIDMLESGAPVDILYFDFCKACDSVPHYRLLTKLENMGITGSTLEIIRDFLSGRSMKSVVRGVGSTPRLVLSGVPQGLSWGHCCLCCSLMIFLMV